MKDIKLFNETFKILLAITVTTWLLYIAFIVFVGDTEDCALGAPGWLFNLFAVTAGVMSAPPLVYGLARTLFSRHKDDHESAWAAGWIVGAGMVIFVIAAVTVALAISQYGCR